MDLRGGGGHSLEAIVVLKHACTRAFRMNVPFIALVTGAPTEAGRTQVKTTGKNRKSYRAQRSRRLTVLVASMILSVCALPSIARAAESHTQSGQMSGEIQENLEPHLQSPVQDVPNTSQLEAQTDENLKDENLEIAQMGTFARATAMPASSDLCTPGTYLSISHKSPGGNWGSDAGARVDIWKDGQWQNQLPKLTLNTYENLVQFNGIGIGQDGTLYAHASFRSTGWKEHRWLSVYQLKPGNQRWTWLGDIELNMSDNAYWVAGGVDPVSGSFYFGQYEKSGFHHFPPHGEYLPDDIELSFELYKFDPTNPGTPNNPNFMKVATVAPSFPITWPEEIEKPEWFLINGDLGFDAMGNLYLVNGHNLGTDIWTLTAEQLEEANGGTIVTDTVVQNRVDPTDRSTQFLKTVNGIAFDRDGRIWMSTPTHHYSYNPTYGTWRNEGQKAPDPDPVDQGISAWNHVDLASCIVPPTLELQKELGGSRYGTEQFRLSILDDQDREHTLPKVTSGSGDKVDGSINTVVIGDQSYTIKEELVGGTNITDDAYETTWECKEKSGYHLPDWGFSGTGTSGAITIPEVVHDEHGNAVPPNLICTFTNTPRLGSVSWKKVDDSAPPVRLGGSAWELSGPVGANGNAGTITVTDCVANDAAQCDPNGHDIDPSEGGFTVKNLHLGQYTLKETQSPNGYEGLADVKAFTLDTSHFDLDLGDIVNTKKLGQVTWAKVDEEGRALAHSEWTLSGPVGVDGSAGTVAVTDCVGRNERECQGPDRNPQAGRFTVENLNWGDYTLIESKAPAGYEKAPDSHDFTINATQLNYSFTQAFINTKKAAPVLPLTGGLSRGAYALFGAGLVLADLLFVTAFRLKKGRTQ